MSKLITLYTVKYVQFIVCQPHLNRAVFKHERKKHRDQSDLDSASRTHVRGV